MLKHMCGGCKCLLDGAQAQLEIERNIGPLAALEVLEIGEGAGGTQLRVYQGLVLGGLELVEYRRELLIFRHDQLGRSLGEMRIVGEHDSNRLAYIMHLIDCQDRLIVESGAVI